MADFPRFIMQICFDVLDAAIISLHNDLVWPEDSASAFAKEYSWSSVHTPFCIIIFDSDPRAQSHLPPKLT